jgi:hypothetical protein
MWMKNGSREGKDGRKKENKIKYVGIALDNKGH